MTARWTCLEKGCGRHGIGSWSEVDKSAERHTADEQHATTTSTVGSVRVRDANGVRDLRAGGEG